MSEVCGYCGRGWDRYADPMCKDKQHREPDTAEKIVQEIENDLSDRRGLRQEFEGCDDDIQWEIRETWADIVRMHLKEEIK
tara:strand:- start:5110 stop:5352 length:243 start_codon:yes stop_codon:yes gene_type:complete